MRAGVDTQRCYRSLLAAMAEPGTMHELGGGVALVLATLADHEVTVAELGDPRWGDADFVVVRGGTSGGALAEARAGTLLEPAEGATAIYELDEVGSGPLALHLEGPGVGAGGRELQVRGLDPAEVALFVATRAAYPVGIDVVLVDAGGCCACLPRSTTISLLGEEV